MVRRECQGTRRHWFPRSLRCAERLSAAPWDIRAGFSASVGKLYSWNRALSFDETRNLTQRLDLRVFPQSEVRRGNAAPFFNRGRFRHDESRAAYRATAEMDKVPVVCHPVNTRVFTHRRYC